MRKRIAFTMVFVAVVYFSASATIISIPDDYLTIQEGIDASDDGDTVLVEQGTYTERINFNGKNITVASNYIFSGDTLDIQNTTIDGDSSGSVITFASEEDGSSSITGFTIRNGYSQNGGGIYCYNATPIVSDNIITENSVNTRGAGIYCSEAAPLITRNVISGNQSHTWGAGIDCHSANPVIDGNVIINNSAEAQGGGIYCYSANPVIIDNIISGNYARFSGAGIYASISAPHIVSNRIFGNNCDSNGGGIGCDGGNPLIATNLIVGNTADPSGGGIYCSGTNPYVVNNTLCLNRAGLLGGGIFVINDSNPSVINCILWADSSEFGPEIYAINSSPVVSFCDVQGGWEGNGNIDTDPLFRDLENDDFRLMATGCGNPYDSPCIDTGHPEILDSLLDCSWGLGTILSDMGAYGGGDSVLVGIGDQDIVVPSHFALIQNYPNPFNASTNIQYSLPSASHVTIDIYDILGRRVVTLAQGLQQPGYHQVMWHASDHSSGLYFYRILAGEYAETRKMVLLK